MEKTTFMRAKKDALAEALKRHLKISKLGKILSPDESEFFLSVLTTGGQEKAMAGAA